MKAFGPRQLLDCYRSGVFPMARDRHDPRLFLVDPEDRAVIPLDAFHIPRRLARTVRATAWRVACDGDFRGVVEACAAPAPGRENTWINDSILELYSDLFATGHAHSVEVRDGTDALVGGVYGVSIGAAFFGESMFSRARDASKIALVHLVARLRAGKYRLLDVQFMTEHLRQFGTVEVPRAEYLRRLADALAVDANFPAGPLSGADAVAIIRRAHGA